MKQSSNNTGFLFGSSIRTLSASALLVGLLASGASAQVTDYRLGTGEEGIASTSAVAAKTAGEVVNYWTPARMQAAKPVPMPSADASQGATVRSQAETQPADEPPMLMPGWNPQSGKPQPDESSLIVLSNDAQASGAATGQTAPQIFGSPPAHPLDYANYGKFQRWTWDGGRYLRYPISTIGKMFFTQNGQNFVCSGTVWFRSMFLTAGHCVSDGAGNFSTNILLCPSWRPSGIPNPARGCWAGIFISTTTDWHTASDFDRDYACVVTNPTGTIVANKIGNVTGWVGWAANWGTDEMMFATGYPQASPFNGNRIIVNAANEWYAVNLDPSDPHVSKYMGNDMTGGSSGGSWLMSMRDPQAEHAVVDNSAITDPTATSGKADGPFANGLNSHKRCRNSCFTPPTAAAGTFWSEMGSPNFTRTAADTRDIHDIYLNCRNNGGR